MTYYSDIWVKIRWRGERNHMDPKSVPGKGNDKCNGLIRSISGILTKCVVTEEVYRRWDQTRNGGPGHIRSCKAFWVLWLSLGMPYTFFSSAQRILKEKNHHVMAHREKLNPPSPQQEQNRNSLTHNLWSQVIKVKIHNNKQKSLYLLEL